MNLLACGFNHREMTLVNRERWALLPDSWSSHLAGAKNALLREAVIVSTCNRTELYAVADSQEQVLQYFHQLYSEDKPCPSQLYWHESEAAVRHLMRVSSGLDSVCLGEPQILGQIKQAYQVACEVGTVGVHFRALFPAAFSVGKQIRSQTELGVGAVTLAYAVCQLVRQLYKKPVRRRVLCIGAGETIESMLRHLSGQPLLEVVLINRSSEKAIELAKQYAVDVRYWHELDTLLEKVDMVITATASREPIISRTQVAAVALKRQSDDPLFFADLAVPRDVDPTVSELPGVFLYNLDDMQQVLEKNQSHREIAAQKARAIVDEEAERFVEKSKIAAKSNVIRIFRESALELRDQCLERALNQLQAGSDAELVLRRLANDLTNKLIHEPTIQLRELISNYWDDEP